MARCRSRRFRPGQRTFRQRSDVADSALDRRAFSYRLRMPSISRMTLLVVLTAAVGTGCDLYDGTGAVRGRVVDDATRGAVSPGTVRVTVRGVGLFADAFAPTLASGEAGADGRFALPGSSGTGSHVELVATGWVDYPGRDTVGPQAATFRLAYFPASLPYRRALGTVVLSPTCTTLGSVRFTRPLARSEQLRVAMVPVPEVPPTTRRSGSWFTYEGRPAEGSSAPDTLRLLSVGARAVRLTWELNEYSPPAGNGLVVARGNVELPTCPRHGVLRYSATLALPQ